MRRAIVAVVTALLLAGCGEGFPPPPSESTAPQFQDETETESQTETQETESEETETSSDCDSNYSGCVPVYPPDVNCEDVDGPVNVTGEDVHQLDREGDGEACEDP